jgi:hypothetical protein
MSVRSSNPVLIRYLAALVLFCAAAVAVFPGIAFHPDSRVSCCIGDGTGTIRDYWVTSLEHKNPLTFTHDAWNGAPEGLTTTPATLLANGGVQTGFVWTLRHPLGLVASWNAFMAVGLIGTSLAMFALLQWLGCTFVASLFGGYVFGFSPYALERVYAGHLGLMQNWVLLLAIFAVIRLRERRTYARAAALGAAIGLAFYVSAYQGLFASVAVLAFLAVDLVRIPGRRERIRTLALLTLAYVTGVVLLTPIFVLYSRDRSTVNAQTAHANSDLYTFAARVSDYLLPSPRNPLFHWLRSIHQPDLTEQTLFFGYAALILAVAAVVLLFRRDTWLRGSDRRWGAAISMAVLAPAAFLLSLPPSYHISGTPIPMASVLLAAFTSTWRDYARFGIVVGLALSVLAALAISALARRRGWAWQAIGPVALAVAVVELLPGNIGVFNTKTGPGWVMWLASHPHGIVATYPMDLHGGPESVLRGPQVWYQTVDKDPGFEIVGESYIQARSWNQAIRTLALDIGAPLTPRILSTEGVRYVVVDDDVYRSAGHSPPSLDRRWFTQLARLGDVRIFSVHAPHVDLSSVIESHRDQIVQLQAGLYPPGQEIG